MLNLDDKVQITVVGYIKGLEKLRDGRVKYEVLADNDSHCFVYEENLITIHKGEPHAFTNQN